MQRLLACLGAICLAGCGDAALKDKVSALERENQELKTRLDQALLKPNPKPVVQFPSQEQILDYLDGKPIVIDKAPLLLRKADIGGLSAGSSGYPSSQKYNFSYAKDDVHYVVDVTIRYKNHPNHPAIVGLTIDGIARILVVKPGS